MLTIYGDTLSGNCYKIKLLCEFIDVPYHWRHVNILENETHTDPFKAMNPNTRIPVIELESGEHLWESNAILNYLAEGTDWLPASQFERAKVLQWQFFEQYSHEPFIATARYINIYLGLPKGREQEYKSKQPGGHKALAVMDSHLSHHHYFVGSNPSIADISLYAYTHVAHEGGFDLSPYSNIQRWLKDFESIHGYIPMTQDPS